MPSVPGSHFSLTIDAQVDQSRMLGLLAPGVRWHMYFAKAFGKSSVLFRVELWLIPKKNNRVISKRLEDVGKAAIG